jgi:catechol 2,3-dioxygenase-like lactoylglutathione lyase family enzyme
MIFGAHVVLYSKDAAADRAFFSDMLGLASVDAGHGWLIFALPPAEAAVHPVEGLDGEGRHELYLLCDDLAAEMERLVGKGVACEPMEEARWGLLTRMHLPGGGRLGLYQPRHAVAIGFPWPPLH